MGRLVIPIGIDVDRVNSIFGSKDELLFDELLKSKWFEKFDENYSFKRELSSLVFNYVQPANRKIILPKLFGLIKGSDGSGLGGDWNDYGYALLTTCCHLGHIFSEDSSEFVYGDSWWQINTLLRTNGCKFDLSRMLESQRVFDTPYEQTDIYTNIYTKKEVVEFASHLLIIEKDIEQNNLALFNSLKKGVLNCMNKNLDIIVFSYET